MDDLRRQAAVQQATKGCLAAIGLLSLAAIRSIVVTLSSAAIVTLAVLLIHNWLILGVIE